MAEFDKELLEKAKQANSSEELLALAKENNVELTQEQAVAYFEQMNKSGVLSDDELDNVAGGTCYNDGRPVVTIANCCELWTCGTCGEVVGKGDYHKCPRNWGSFTAYDTVDRHCKTCKYCTYEKALWICNHPDRKK